MCCRSRDAASRHEAFLETLVANGLVSPIEGDDLDWSFAGRPPIYSVEAPATRLREMLALRSRSGA